MAIKSVVVPWFSGGALLLGYAAFAWLRGKRALPSTPPPPAHEAFAPLAENLERVPEELALRAEAPHARHSARSAFDHDAQFLDRSIRALDPFQKLATNQPLKAHGH